MNVYVFEIYFKDFNCTKVIYTRSCANVLDAVQLLLDFEIYGLSDNFDRPYFTNYNCEFVLRKLSENYGIHNFICSYHRDNENNKVLLCNNKDTFKEIGLNKRVLIKDRNIYLKFKD